MTDRTTINIAKEIRELLKSKRQYKRETYDEILKRELNLKNKIKKMANPK